MKSNSLKQIALANQPIGVFDSGVGGLSVLQSLIQLLPNESFNYFADSGRCPYGPLSPEEIWSNTCRIMEILKGYNCKLVVVACNTITTNSIERLRENYNIPIIGMEPGTKMAFQRSKGKRIGILATQGTLNGSLFNQTLRDYKDHAFFQCEVGHGLVELIEQNAMDSPKMRTHLAALLQPFIEAAIDTLVLGCTHYNYLTPLLLELFPFPIQIIDTSQAVAKQVKKILVDNALLCHKTDRKILLETSGAIEPLKQILKRLTLSTMTIKNIHFSSLKE